MDELERAQRVADGYRAAWQMATRRLREQHARANRLYSLAMEFEKSAERAHNDAALAEQKLLERMAQD